MCVNCALNAFEQGAAAGSSSAPALGMRKLGNRLLAMNLRWVTVRRLKAATAIVVTLGLIVVASSGSG